MQRGAVTLLLVGALLLLSLGISLWSYKQVLFQLQATHNSLKYKQQRWIAEGGLECAYAQIRTLGYIPKMLDNCGLPAELELGLQQTENSYRITASVDPIVIHQSIDVMRGLQHGAMQTSADIYANTGLVFSPPDPGYFTEQGWQCIALRFQARRYSRFTVNQGVLGADQAWHGFNSTLEGKQQCQSSLSSAHNHFSTGIGADYQQQADLKLFSSFFGVNASQHEVIRDSGIFYIIEGSGDPQQIPNCGTVVTDALAIGEHFIWLEGSCEIKEAELSNIVHATQATEGVLLVIHDGLFSIMGTSLTPFKGVIFHFNYDYLATPADWENVAFAGSDALYHSSDFVADSSYRDVASYYQHGDFYLTGSLFLDMPEQAAIFNKTLNIAYQRDVLNYLRGKFVPPKWQQGTWHDF